MFLVTTSFSQNISFELLQKHHNNSPDWDYVLNDFDRLGASAPLGDLYKDGNKDMLFGIPGDGTELGLGGCNNDGVVNSKELIPKGSLFLDSNLNC